MDQSPPFHQRTGYIEIPNRRFEDVKRGRYRKNDAMRDE